MSSSAKKIQTEEVLIDEAHSSMNLDMAYEKIGGFGLFQLFATIQLAIWRNAGGWFINLYPYLVLPQSFQCKFQEGGSWQSCEAST